MDCGSFPLPPLTLRQLSSSPPDEVSFLPLLSLFRFQHSTTVKAVNFFCVCNPPRRRLSAEQAFPSTSPAMFCFSTFRPNFFRFQRMVSTVYFYGFFRGFQREELHWFSLELVIQIGWRSPRSGDSHFLFPSSRVRVIARHPLFVPLPVVLDVTHFCVILTPRIFPFSIPRLWSLEVSFVSSSCPP